MKALTYTESEPERARLFRMIAVPTHGNDGPDYSTCWLWIGGVNSKGYGQFKLAGRMVGAHRMSFVLHYKAAVLQPREFVLHTCDVPACCNPHHLFIGTQLDNIRDMMAKGRQRGLIFAGGDSAREAQRRGVEARKAKRARGG
jgi:hypothetical protein